MLRDVEGSYGVWTHCNWVLIFFWSLYRPKVVIKWNFKNDQYKPRFIVPPAKTKFDHNSNKKRTILHFKKMYDKEKNLKKYKSNFRLFLARIRENSGSSLFYECLFENNFTD